MFCRPAAGFPRRNDSRRDCGRAGRLPVASGFKSMTSPRCIPLRPTRLPDCPMNVALARRAGNRSPSKPECLTSAHDVQPPVPAAARLIRMLLNGMRTSTSYPPIGDTTVRLEHEVGTQIGFAPVPTTALPMNPPRSRWRPRPGSRRLDPQRIHRKHQDLLSVLKRASRICTLCHRRSGRDSPASPWTAVLPKARMPK